MNIFNFPLNLLESKVISFATRIDPGQPAVLCRLTRPYTVGILIFENLLVFEWTIVNSKQVNSIG
jgi:hypothetical protein